VEWSVAIREHFAQLALQIGTRGAIGEVTALLAAGQTSSTAYLELVEQHGVARERWFQKDRLDLVIGFVRSILELGPLNPEHLRDVTQLKEFLHVAEGELASERPAEIASLLQEQLEIILADREITEQEDLYQVELQRAFDLGYDQYLLLIRTVLEKVWADLSAIAVEDSAHPEALRIRNQLIALEPMYRLAVAQPRTLGALY
jgi:hypothetical protein